MRLVCDDRFIRLAMLRSRYGSYHMVGTAGCADGMDKRRFLLCMALRRPNGWPEGSPVVRFVCDSRRMSLMAGTAETEKGGIGFQKCSRVVRKERFTTLC